MKTEIRILILVLLFLYCNIYSQDNKNIFTSTSQNMQNPVVNANGLDILKDLQLQGAYNPNFKMISLEGAVNSDTYIVGPNDQFELGLFGYINQQIPLIVSLEGFLVIPTVGQVKASGLSISELRNSVVEAVKKRYYSSEVSFVLSVPRTFLVNVAGLKQGTYQANSVMRVSSIVNFVLLMDTANVMQYYQYQSDQRAEKFFNTFPSLRNVELIRKNGQVQKVDLYKFFSTREDKCNPYLMDGDMIKIPNFLVNSKFITINGAVQLMGNYEYSEDDDLETILGLARGFDANAEPDSILLFRPYGDNKGFDLINLSYERDKNFKINNFDRIFVKFKTDYQKSGTVLVLGEIQRPGYYPITFKNTKLKDAIEMAGGFRENAYLPLCILFRKYDEEYTIKDTTEMLINWRANDVLFTERDRLNFLGDIQAKRNRVVVDFEKLYKSNDESQNIMLEHNDIIYINDDKKIVYVYGQVNNEGYVQYKKDEDAEYYIEKAGGYGLGADEGNTRIIKFNSRGWYKPGDTEISSGDFIYVPRSEKKTFAETISLIAQISSVLLGVITTYILIRNTK